MDYTKCLKLTAQNAGTVITLAGYQFISSLSDPDTDPWNNDYFVTTVPGEIVYVKGNIAPFGKVFNISDNVTLSGCIMSLIDNGAGTSTSIPDPANGVGAFQDLFTAGKILGLSEELLPDTENLPELCYYNLFSQSTVPSIPKDLIKGNIGENSCTGMFSQCNDLELTGTIFKNATSVGQNGCIRMFGWSGITSIPEGFLPFTTLGKNCFEGMFQGCSSLETLPEGLLPVTTLKQSCYKDMFMNCSKIEELPDDMLPAETLVDKCYSGMFNGCSSLKKITVGFKSWFAPDSNAVPTQDWVAGVSENGTFVSTFKDLKDLRGVNNIPENWDFNPTNKKVKGSVIFSGRYAMGVTKI